MKRGIYYTATANSMKPVSKRSKHWDSSKRAVMVEIGSEHLC